MREDNASFGHHVHQVSGTQLETQIPPDTKDNDLLIEMSSFEDINGCCAGSHFAIVAERPTISRLHQNPFFLGMFDFASYPSRAFRLCKGDILVVYSDGLTDAQNRQEEVFGEERLLKIIQQEAPSGSHALEENLLKMIEEFTQGMPQTRSCNARFLYQHARFLHLERNWCRYR